MGSLSITEYFYVSTTGEALALPPVLDSRFLVCALEDSPTRSRVHSPGSGVQDKDPELGSRIRINVAVGSRQQEQAAAVADKMSHLMLWIILLSWGRAWDHWLVKMLKSEFAETIHLGRLS